MIVSFFRSMLSELLSVDEEPDDNVDDGEDTMAIGGLLNYRTGKFDSWEKPDGIYDIDGLGVDLGDQD